LRTIFSGVADVTSSPARRTEPAAAFSAPAMHISVEDLPAPLAPIRATSSPLATLRLMPRTARMAP
jgi:hypothetical protein